MWKLLESLEPAEKVTVLKAADEEAKRVCFVTFELVVHKLSLLVAAELDEALQHSDGVVSKCHLEGGDDSRGDFQTTWRQHEICRSIARFLNPHTFFGGCSQIMSTGWEAAGFKIKKHHLKLHYWKKKKVWNLLLDWFGGYLAPNMISGTRGRLTCFIFPLTKSWSSFISFFFKSLLQSFLLM